MSAKVEPADPKKTLFAELLGTFLLVLIGAGAVIVESHTGVSHLGKADGKVGLTGIALAHGFTLMGLVYSLGPISGAHFNPAVSVAAWMQQKLRTDLLLGYVGAQVAGALAAAALLAGIFPDEIRLAALGTPQLATNIGVLKGIVIEAAITFVLVSTILFVTAQRAPDSFAGLAIGATLAGVIFFAGPLTGAAANPARYLGPAIFSLRLEEAPVYLAGPLLGGGLAALVTGLLLDVDMSPALGGAVRAAGGAVRVVSAAGEPARVEPGPPAELAHVVTAPAGEPIRGAAGQADEPVRVTSGSAVEQGESPTASAAIPVDETQPASRKRAAAAADPERAIARTREALAEGQGEQAAAELLPLLKTFASHPPETRAAIRTLLMLAAAEPETSGALDEYQHLLYERDAPRVLERTNGRAPAERAAGATSLGPAGDNLRAAVSPAAEAGSRAPAAAGAQPAEQPSFAPVTVEAAPVSSDPKQLIRTAHELLEAGESQQAARSLLPLLERFDTLAAEVKTTLRALLLVIEGQAGEIALLDEYRQLLTAGR